MLDRRIGVCLGDLQGDSAVVRESRITESYNIP